MKNEMLENAIFLLDKAGAHDAVLQSFPYMIMALLEGL